MGTGGTTTDEALRDLIAVAAVGALPTLERVALDRVLALRPDLVVELRELEAVATVLADGWAVEPPARLWANVVAKLPR